ncbi:MAG: histidine kinase [Prevotellaceae bacterium]|jgi:sensor histidine kinase YesM|nr:histidine kinase [Prevotellaceae bacterium]
MDTANYLKDNLLLDFIVNPGKRIYRHILLFSVLGLLILGNANAMPDNIDRHILYLVAGLYLCCIVVLYVNLYVLVPRLLFNNKYGKYFLSILSIIAVSFLMLAGSVGLFFSLHTHLSEDIEEINMLSILDGFLSYFIVFGSFIASSTAIKLFQRRIMDNQRIYELEKNTMTAEMEQLKNQITPHFLFNTLNNTSVLINTDPEKASQTVMMLSDLLRYQLYDSVRETVLLSSDIRFLTDFLNLEKIRRDNFEFFIETEGLTDLLIPPLMFIPFVENAVKHSAGSKISSCVHLKFSVKERELSFVCINSKPENPQQEKQGGLGLANIRRRLDLLYQGNYELTIQDKKNTYRVKLNIGL